jgi:hypothetical protein
MEALEGASIKAANDNKLLESHLKALQACLKVSTGGTGYQLTLNTLCMHSATPSHNLCSDAMRLATCPACGGSQSSIGCQAHPTAGCLPCLFSVNCLCSLCTSARHVEHFYGALLLLLLLRLSTCRWSET